MTVPTGGATYTLEVAYFEWGLDADAPGNAYRISAEANQPAPPPRAARLACSTASPRKTSGCWP